MFEKREIEILQLLGEIVKTDEGRGLLCELSKIISKKNKEIRKLKAEKSYNNYKNYIMNYDDIL